MVQKPSDLKSKKEFETFENLSEKEKQKTKNKFEKEKIYYWLKSLKPKEIKSMVAKAQKTQKWEKGRKESHLRKKDLDHTFEMGYLNALEKTRNEFSSLFFKTHEKKKQIVFYNKELNSLVMVDISASDYIIKTLYKNTKKKSNFMNTIKVDEKPKYKYLNIDVPLKQYIEETLDFLKDMREDCDDGEVEHALLALMEANGTYPEYDIEFLDTFDIQILVDYTSNYYHKNDTDKSWHFFVYNIKEGTYPLELLSDHVRGILKERYYKGK